MIGSQARMPYLAVALLSQRVVDTSSAFLRGGGAQRLEWAQEDALALLDPANIHEAGGALPGFEELRTVADACEPEERAQAATALRRVSGGSGSKEDAAFLIQVFTKVEARALRNMEEPPTPLPKGLAALHEAR